MKKDTDINWDEVMNKFSLHSGNIVEFCKENKVNVHQLYYRRKKMVKDNSPKFHAIPISKETIDRSVAMNNTVNKSTDIRIELGKFKIFVPGNNKELLLGILQELAKSC